MRKILTLVLVLGLLVLGGCELANQSKDSETNKISLAEAKSVAQKFINEALMPPGQTVSIKEVVEEGGFYKITLNTSSGQEFTSYLSLDGKQFFPTGLDIEEETKKAAARRSQSEAQEAQTLADLPKSAKPQVELFVMSHCPFGLQAEKGILPVVKKLGDKIDFQIKFVDYAMHGEKEVKEQLNQYCIQKEEPQKFIPYLECFLGDGDGEKCLKEAAIDVGKMRACTKETDQEFKIMAMYEDRDSYLNGRYPQFNIYKKENDEYGVQGSPTLVINGYKISSRRAPADLLKTICAAFEEQPEECNAELSSETPPSGFGYSGSGSEGGGCGG